MSNIFDCIPCTHTNRLTQDNSCVYCGATEVDILNEQIVALTKNKIEAETIISSLVDALPGAHPVVLTLRKQGMIE